MQNCTNELYWMDTQEEDRLRYDWSDQNLDYKNRHRQYEVPQLYRWSFETHSQDQGDRVKLSICYLSLATFEKVAANLFLINYCPSSESTPTVLFSRECQDLIKEWQRNSNICPDQDIMWPATPVARCSFDLHAQENIYQPQRKWNKGSPDSWDGETIAWGEIDQLGLYSIHFFYLNERGSHWNIANSAKV